MFYLNSTLNFGILKVLVFQLEVYYKVDRLLTGLTTQQKGSTARWCSNKTSLSIIDTTIFNQVYFIYVGLVLQLTEYLIVSTLNIAIPISEWMEFMPANVI